MLFHYINKGNLYNLFNHSIQTFYTTTSGLKLEFAYLMNSSWWRKRYLSIVERLRNFGYTHDSDIFKPQAISQCFTYFPVIHHRSINLFLY